MPGPVEDECQFCEILLTKSCRAISPIFLSFQLFSALLRALECVACVLDTTKPSVLPTLTRLAICFFLALLLS